MPPLEDPTPVRVVGRLEGGRPGVASVGAEPLPTGLRRGARRLSSVLRRFAALLALALCAAWSFASSPRGDELYGVGCVDFNALIHIDTDHLVARVIGPVGSTPYRWGGIAFAEDGTPYGHGDEKLYRIPLTGGQSTYLGGLQTWLLFGLAIDPFDGVICAVKRGKGGNCRLATIRPALPSLNVFGPNSALCATGLAFDAWGRLFGVDSANNQLLRFDKTTGVATVVGPNGLANHPRLSAITFGRSGTLWAVERGPGFGPLRLLSIDSETGVPQVVGNLRLDGSFFTCGSFTMAGLTSYIPPHPRLGPER